MNQQEIKENIAMHLRAYDEHSELYALSFDELMKELKSCQ